MAKFYLKNQKLFCLIYKYYKDSVNKKITKYKE